MSAVQKTTFFSGETLTDASNLSEGVTTPPRAKRCIGFLHVPAPGGDIVVTAKIEHSPDKVNWIEYAAFDATDAGAASTQDLVPTGDKPLFPYVRGNIALAGTDAEADPTMELYYESF